MTFLRQGVATILQLAFWGTLIWLPAAYYFGDGGATHTPVKLPAYTTRLIEEDIECGRRFQFGSIELTTCLNDATRRCLADLIHQPHIDVDDCDDPPSPNE